MLDYATNPHHSLTTDGGEYGSPTGPSESLQPKPLSARVPNGFFGSRCDQNSSAVKPMPFDPNEKLFLLLPPEYGRRSQRKGTEFKTATSY